MSGRYWLRRSIGLAALLCLLLVVGCGRQEATPNAPEGEGQEMSDEAAMQDAIVAFFEAEGSDLPSKSTIAIEAIEGDYARARMTPNDPAATDPATIFLKRQDGKWTMLTYGTAFGPDVYAGFGIPTSLQLEGASEMAFVPLSDEECAALQAAASEALAHEATVMEAPINDYVTGEAGMGCQVTLVGTGADFASVSDVMERLKSSLVAAGWSEEMGYTADGPTGSALGFQSDNKLLLVTVGWQPADEANCSPEQPIMECNVLPEQQLYTITLNAAARPLG